MKLIVKIKFLIMILYILLVVSCEDFVDVEVPNHKIVSEAVFESDETAINAMTGIYNELFNASFSGGWQNSVTVLAGLSADVLQPINPDDSAFGEFYQNEIMPASSPNLNIWSSAYNIIYMTNAVLEGIEQSDNITEEVGIRLEGEARFVRAFTYFHLVNIYGDVPLVLATDYRKNSLVSQDTVEEINVQVFADLEKAMDLLGIEYLEGERTHVNRLVVMAFLARVHLYQQNWEQAESLSNQVISHTDTYEILKDLKQVFLANSREAIWQISPIGRGNILTTTNEAPVFIGTSYSYIKITEGFMQSIHPEDKRLTDWIGHFTNETRNFHFPYKYKDRSSLNNITEYSMVLRLAEQYLIRAEARTMQGNLTGAIADVDEIRDRAGVDLITDTSPGIDKETLLNLIMKERKLELFSEWGHRWLDLKRTGKATEILGIKTSLWEDTDVLYPIPEEERAKNPNLGQNHGY